EIGERLHDAIRAFGSVARTRTEIMEFLESEHGIPPGQGDPLWYALRTRARLTHAPESGLWRAPGRTRYVTIEHEQPEPDSARVELVRRYLAAFGPAARARRRAGARVARAARALSRRSRPAALRPAAGAPPLRRHAGAGPAAAALRQSPPGAQGPDARHGGRASPRGDRRRLGALDAPRRRPRGGDVVARA